MGGKTPLPTLVSFEVHLVSNLRLRRRRLLVIDTEAGTLSRSRRDDAAGEATTLPRRVPRASTASGAGEGDAEAFDLRKTIEIGSSFMLLPSEEDKRKLRVFVDPHTRPLEIVFASAGEREQFSSVIRTIRARAPSLPGRMSSASAASDRSEDALRKSTARRSARRRGRSGRSARSARSGRSGRSRAGSNESAESAGPSRLSVFCTTFNVSKQPVPGVARRKRSHHGDGRQRYQLDLAEEEEEEEEEGPGEESEAHHDDDAGHARGVLALGDLYDWLPPDEFDVYFVGLQECKSKHFQDWQQLILGLVNRRYEDNLVRGSGREKDKDRGARAKEYKVLSAVSMWSIHGVLIVRERLAKHFSHLHTDTRACGLGGVIGNKGAVGISLRYGEGTNATSTSFAFVNAHLPARAERLGQRAQIYADICHSLLLRRKGASHNTQLLHAYDHVFWVGDLNYRTDMGQHGSLAEFEHVTEVVRDGGLELLAPHDQLSQERAKHNVFVGFREGDLQFAPTYRLEFGRSGEYNNKRNQSPSWTDRVLWRSMPGRVAHVELADYYSSEGMIFSDHRPVCACFSVLTACGAYGTEYEVESRGNKELTIATASQLNTLRRMTTASAIAAIRSRALTSKPRTTFTEVQTAGEPDPDLDIELDADPDPYFSFVKIEYLCKLLDEKQDVAADERSYVDEPPSDVESVAVPDSVKLGDDEVDDDDDDDDDDSGRGLGASQGRGALAAKASMMRSGLQRQNSRASIEPQGRGSTLASKRDAAAAPEQEQEQEQTQRRHSYRRPAASSLDLALLFPAAAGDIPSAGDEPLASPNDTFAGKGFASGKGELSGQALEHCCEESPEFTRYVPKANAGLHNASTKLWVQVHAPFLEDAPPSKHNAGSVQSAGRGPQHLQYSWTQPSLPRLHPFVLDPDYLADSQVVVTVRRTARGYKHGQIIGHAHIPLRDIALAPSAWFVVPVLWDGLPAGVLRGELANPFYEEMAERFAARRASSRGGGLDCAASFVSDADIARRGKGGAASRNCGGGGDDDDDDDDDDAESLGSLGHEERPPRRSELMVMVGSDEVEEVFEAKVHDEDEDGADGAQEAGGGSSRGGFLRRASQHFRSLASGSSEAPSSGRAPRKSLVARLKPGASTSSPTSVSTSDVDEDASTDPYVQTPARTRLLWLFGLSET